MQRNTITRRDLLLAKPAHTTERDFQPVQTPTGDFFRQRLRHIPRIDPAFWAFGLGGLAAKPLVIPYETFMTLPTVELCATLVCVGSTPAHPLMSSARWRGVPLAALLADAQPKPEARFAQWYGADGYTTFTELSRLGEAILAYEMNGEPLPPEHGFPVRLIVPGVYGYKMPKWIQRLQLTDAPANGFWEQRGCSANGDVLTLSAITAPRHLESVRGPVVFEGFAFAGARLIAGVDISIDDGPWMPVPLGAAIPYTWRPWRITWTPPAPGNYRVKVRATDSDGFIQPAAAPAFPDGSTAIQTIIIRVTA
ncbi:MAG: molybdopterin-dependent oxidoreductase [Chloroflexi bacterium]|nr:molybdopterin-dependent oxidoreductase [Chloroflexota bacterium]